MKQKVIIENLGSNRTDYLNKNYPLSKSLGPSSRLTFYQMLREEQVITEFLYTVNSTSTIKDIKTKFKNIDVTIDKTGHSTSIGAIVVRFKEPKVEKELSQRMLILGWFPAAVEKFETEYEDGFNGSYSNFQKQFSKIEINDPFIVYYEAKYDTDEDMSNIKYLYHVAPDIYDSSIRTVGLTVKTQSKLANHPERIYLLKDKNRAELLANALWSRSKFSNQATVYNLYQIDISKLNKHKFFVDINFEGGYYVNDIIPSAVIKKVDSFLFDK